MVGKGAVFYWLLGPRSSYWFILPSLVPLLSSAPRVAASPFLHRLRSPQSMLILVGKQSSLSQINHKISQNREN